MTSFFARKVIIKKENHLHEPLSLHSHTDIVIIITQIGMRIIIK